MSYQACHEHDGYVTIMRSFGTLIEAFLYASTESTLFVRDCTGKVIELSHEEKRGLARDVISDAAIGYRELNAARVLWAELSNVQPETLVVCHSCGCKCDRGLIDGWGCQRPGCCERPDDMMVERSSLLTSLIG